MTTKAIRGAFFDFIDDPWKHVGNEKKAARFYPDGMLVVENGKIKAFGPYDKISSQFLGIQTTHIKNRLILPGFVDGHIHMPQTRVLGVYGQQLLGWLLEGIFPEERKYSDPAYAKEGAKHFFDDLLAGGTTTCQAFLTHAPVCTDAFFEEVSGEFKVNKMNKSHPRRNNNRRGFFYLPIEKHQCRPGVFVSHLFLFPI